MNSLTDLRKNMLLQLLACASSVMHRGMLIVARIIRNVEEIER